MSLIQDALKRQQEESESSRVPPKAAAAPFVPDAMPVPPSPPATLGVALRAGPEPVNQPLPANQPLPTVPPVDPEKPVQPGKSWKRIAGIIIFCVLIAWSGVLLVVLIMKQSAERTLLGQFMPDLTKAHASLGKTSVQAPPPAAQPPATAMSKPVVTPSPARAVASRPWISPAAAAAPAFADEGEEDLEKDVVLPSVKEKIGSVAVPEPATWPRRKLSAIFSNAGSDKEGARLKPVVWPRLKLSAIFSNVGSGQAGARLNNRLILLGDQIEGVTLIEIRRDSVVLKCGKETRSLKMGMTLN
ncbi:MAG: alanine and proline-rich secreted protein Apa [Kiritimatiellae bacterium]|nr:alanine and proline-rich secreted protein Apa [Verrucomicrobiota bacterium]MCG2661444.1 alanine and proline-rich secreted protein Apa [Kiritimatiellia bacterium]